MTHTESDFGATLCSACAIHTLVGKLVWRPFPDYADSLKSMSSKEIKSRLKAAKAAVDEKDYEKTLKQCQVGAIVGHQPREIGVHYLE